MVFAGTGIERTVEEKAECVVQFLDKNIALNVLCAMAAFFLPATIMCGLYLRLVLMIKLKYFTFNGMKNIVLSNSLFIERYVLFTNDTLKRIV